MKIETQDDVQHVKQETVVAELKRIGVPQSTLSALVGISEALLSMWLSGKRPLNIDLQRRILNSLAFLSGVHTASPYPVDFSNVAALESHWQQFLEKRSA